MSTQLNLNNIVEVTIEAGITATDGSVTKEPISFTFLTTTVPSYSSIRKLRIEYGGFLGDLADDIIQLGILEASLEATELTFAHVQNTQLFEHARREWVTCKTAITLLNNIGNILLKSKTLGDFSVTYDTNALRDTANKALDCLSRWEPQVITGGFAKDMQQPIGVIKGEYDPDRPEIGRDWAAAGEFRLDEGYPAVNAKSRNYRRSEKIYRSNKKRYW